MQKDIDRMNVLINDISTAELERKGNASEIESFLKNLEVLDLECL